MNCACSICGEPVKRKISIYCSNKCKGIGMGGNGNHRWKGGIKYESDGYRITWNPTHIRADSHGYVRNSHLIAEKVLHKPLPPKGQTHHWANIDEDHKIVICEDHHYHMILHQRKRIVDRGGNPNTEKICSFCKQIKDKNEFGKRMSKVDGLQPYCKKCRIEKRQNAKL